MNKKNSIYQFGLVLFASLAVFGLYFMGRTIQPVTKSTSAVTNTNAIEVIEINENELITDAIALLTKEETDVLKSTGIDGVINFWQSVDRNDIAAIYANRNAINNANAQNTVMAGDLSIRAFREVDDTLQKQYFVQNAVSNYEKALEKEEDITTKLKLAKLYTSVTGATMQGVLLLREVVEENPNHIQANYELGLLSLQSGQNDKAMERFNLLIETEPEFIEPYILKAQLLMNDNKQQEAINVLDEAMVNTTNQEGLQVLSEMRNSIQ